ncbi:MAG: alpha/beta fold hydrolase [Arenicellales bacterium WSBS_2016_MAG_OTU3]
MRYLRKGNGPVVVLQHGFLSGATYWEKTIEHLSGSFDVIAVNLPGYAENAGQAPIENILEFSNFVIQLMDELKVEKFSLVGHSMGGMIAQETVLSYPERLHKLVLFGTGPNGVIPGRFETIEASRQRVLNEGPESTINKTVASWFVKGEHDPHFKSGIELARRASLPALLGGYSAWESWSSAARLAQIKSETLIIWGENDRSYNWEQINQLWSNIPNASLGVMPGCAHNAHLENPELFNLLLSEFLSKHS